MAKSEWRYTASSQEVVRTDGVLIAREVPEEFGPMVAAAPDLRDCVEATLLFHSNDEWTNAKRLRWLQLTGRSESTTKALCDMHRAAIARARR